jgi:hypothetical protein
VPDDKHNVDLVISFSGGTSQDPHSVDVYVYAPKSIVGGKMPINTLVGGIIQVD